MKTTTVVQNMHDDTEGKLAKKLISNRMAEAEAEEKLFLAAKARVPDSRVLHNNKVIHLMEIATHMLRGEIAYRQGHFDQAFAQLREAINREDNLPYDEPWGWMTPVAHALGALLLEQGRVDEAICVYEHDLRRWPENMWSLHGLLCCLKQQKQMFLRGADDKACCADNHPELQDLQLRYSVASAQADVVLHHSCYCAGLLPQ